MVSLEDTVQKEMQQPDYRIAGNSLNFSDANATYISQYHGNISAIEQICERNAANGKRSVFFLGEMENLPEIGKEFQKLIKKGKLSNPNEITSKYIQSKLYTNEREIYTLGQEIEAFGGLNNYINTLSQQESPERINHIARTIEKVYRMYKSTKFTKKIKNITDNLPTDIQDKEESNNKKISFYQAAAIEQGLRPLGEIAKKYNATFIEIPTQKSYYSDVKKSYLGEHYHNIENITGAITVGKKRIQGMKSIPDEKEYHRITNNGNETGFDYLLVNIFNSHINPVIINRATKEILSHQNQEGKSVVGKVKVKTGDGFEMKETTQILRFPQTQFKRPKFSGEQLLAEAEKQIRRLEREHQQKEWRNANNQTTFTPDDSEEFKEAA